MEQDNIAIVARLGFRDDYAIALHKDYMKENNVIRISDLESYAGDLSLGTDPEFASRPDGLSQIDKVYGFTFHCFFIILKNKVRLKKK
jgi:osmoprotectant transport system substrate-binding protein